MNTSPVEIFATCPEGRELDPGYDYLQNIIDVARWSEEFGCRGILVYTDNGLLDCWQVAQVILENTKTLAPLIAVQPLYMHPYTAAKKVATYAHLFGRKVYLNLVAGGFKNDLLALCDETPHDDRYLRIIEYTLIIRKLLEDAGPVTFEGKYYSVKNLRMTPPMPPELFPGFTSSGSSNAGMEAARTIGSVAVRYPLAPGESEPKFEIPDSGIGVRIGIIARESAEQAWEVAEERFPEDREGQLKHQMAIKVTDSVWHKQLAAEEKESVRSKQVPRRRSPGPARSVKTASCTLRAPGS